MLHGHGAALLLSDDDTIKSCEVRRSVRWRFSALFSGVAAPVRLLLLCHHQSPRRLAPPRRSSVSNHLCSTAPFPVLKLRKESACTLPLSLYWKISFDHNMHKRP
ncbi:hypothetical protein HN51_071732 [Arachis hypogaea]|uniref:uncharacterized protein LOC110262687 n=1 Tax=Arachis ipaensis TaxID=130454 RepID=UPI000A2B4BFE|nr:uncharacterized protein LOC110262687 [Arachis ipaensis]